MPIYQESGMKIHLPDSESFRISDCTTWEKKLKLNTLKEMDFGFWDRNKQQIILIEVKDFTQLNHPKAKESKKPEDFIESFVKKGTDMLILLSGIWINSTHGTDMKQEILTTCPNFPNTLCKFKLIFVVKTNDPNAGIWLQPLGTKIRNKMHGRTLLFNLDPNTDLLLLDHITAAKNGLPITV
jgi:hypothetical protein